jgi:hypothetical protein
LPASVVHYAGVVSDRVTVFALLAAVAAAGGYALLRPASTPAEPPIVQAPPPPPEARAPATTQGLPPGHPPVGSGAPRGLPPPSDEPPALTWTAPPAWASMPNPNAMRLATYRIPRAGKDSEDAEMSVSRAGGSTEANLDRWVRQFDEAGKDSRATRTVRGLKITVVEVSGAYLSGSMMGGATAKKPGWSLLGAVVETKDSSYFFKMVGPTATVQSARDAFQHMIDGLTPQG